ncbi:MAG: hypothetical protein MJZ55_00595 [Paludibacteraceae bacterium]|nr:hypothetical protein [Paludibacteraceae bacterium]
MLELKFHTKDYPYFYEADGVTLKEEPDESLDDLLDAHKEMCNDITKLAQLEYDIDLKILHINEREQLFDWIPYEGWKLINCNSDGEQEYTIAFRIPPIEDDWLFHHLQTLPSREIALTDFFVHAPEAFVDMICIDANRISVKDFTQDNLSNWTIRVIGEMQTIHNHFIDPT